MTEEAIKKILEKWFGFVPVGALNEIVQALATPPGSSRLLTDEEMAEVKYLEVRDEPCWRELSPKDKRSIEDKSLVKRQRDLTASLVRAECEARVKQERERVLKGLREMVALRIEIDEKMKTVFPERAEVYVARLTAYNDIADALLKAGKVKP